MVSRKSIIDSRRYNTIVYVNPQLISLYSGQRYAGTEAYLYRLHQLGILRLSLHKFLAGRFSYFTKQDYENLTIPVVSTRKYQLLENLLENRDYKGSEWYHDLRSELLLKGYAKHKRIIMKSVNDIDAFFLDYFSPLVSYIQNTEDISSTDIGSAVISKSGKVIKHDGADHRFMLAKILGKESFPLRISGISREWLRRCLDDSEISNVNNFADVIQMCILTAVNNEACGR
jgi:hypothetical protein